MIFTFNLSTSVWVLLGLMVLAALAAAFTGLGNLRAFARTGRRLADETLPEDNAETLPAVSVIVYAKNVERHISDYLTSLLNQDYPDYEVIVVTDASIDNTAEIVETMAQSSPRLRYSFVPPGSRNVSRRKVAITIGAKGARNPVLIMTNAHSEIPSPDWLHRMSRPFASSDTEFTLGASVYPADRDHGAGKWFRRFDSLLRLSQWMGAAMSGKPYRGDAYALGFRRQSFFDRQGFASTNRFVAGEDDIYVNATANAANTAVVFHPDALLNRHLPAEEYPRLWLRDKERYTFTQRYLHTGALRRQALLSLCQWLCVGCGASSILLALPNLFPAAVVAFILIVLWGYEIYLFRRAGALARAGRNFWTAPLFLLVRPLVGAILNMRFTANKSSNYTWKHPK